VGYEIDYLGQWKASWSPGPRECWVEVKEAMAFTQGKSPKSLRGDADCQGGRAVRAWRSRTADAFQGPPEAAMEASKTQVRMKIDAGASHGLQPSWPGVPLTECELRMDLVEA